MVFTLEVTVSAQNKQKHHQDFCVVSVYYSFNNAQGEWELMIAIDMVIKKQLNLVNLKHRRYIISVRDLRASARGERGRCRDTGYGNISRSCSRWPAP